MAPHSSTLAWKTPWTEEPGGLQSMGSQSGTRLRGFTFTSHFPALEKEMAAHSRVLAWRIPGTGMSGGLPSVGSHRDGHDWSDLAAAAFNYCNLQRFLPDIKHISLKPFLEGKIFLSLATCKPLKRKQLTELVKKRNNAWGSLRMGACLSITPFLSLRNRNIKPNKKNLYLFTKLNSSEKDLSGKSWTNS